MKRFTTTIGGKEYTARLDDRVLARFFDWADTVLPNPMDKLKNLDGMPPAVQELLARDALDSLRNRRNAESPDIIALTHSPEGARKLACLSLQRCNPTLTDAEADALIDASIEENGPDNALTPVA